MSLNQSPIISMDYRHILLLMSGISQLYFKIQTDIWKICEVCITFPRVTGQQSRHLAPLFMVRGEAPMGVISTGESPPVGLGAKPLYGIREPPWSWSFFVNKCLNFDVQLGKREKYHQQKLWSTERGPRCKCPLPKYASVRTESQAPNLTTASLSWDRSAGSEPAEDRWGVEEPLQVNASPVIDDDASESGDMSPGSLGARWHRRPPIITGESTQEIHHAAYRWVETVGLWQRELLQLWN